MNRNAQSTDVHFRGNGPTDSPRETEVRQFGKFAAAATKANQLVRRRDDNDD
jgi:hypothetical protein